MSKVRSRDSRAELLVRRLVHSMGYRYRLHDRSLPGTPDLVLRRHKKLIFVHGCFWHRHSDEACKLARLPKSRLDSWEPKLQGNRDRDIRNQVALERLGWHFLIVWECELRDIERTENALRAFLATGNGAGELSSFSPAPAVWHGNEPSRIHPVRDCGVGSLVL